MIRGTIGNILQLAAGNFRRVFLKNYSTEFFKRRIIILSLSCSKEGVLHIGSKE